MIKLKSLLKKILKESVLRGEWWIEDGHATFADGDVGDMNHEAHVINRLRLGIYDELGVDINGHDDFVPDPAELKDKIFDEIGDELTPEELELWNEDEIYRVIISYIKRNSNQDITNILHYMRGHNDKGQSLDVREYALIHWKWQRVKGNVVQTQTLTSDDLKNIVNGLYDAYGEELEEGHTFNIEVMATRSWYQEVPMSALETLNPSKLNEYRSRY